MKRVSLAGLALVLALGGLGGCKQEQLVTVRHGEIVLCTQGEVISDTTEEVQVPADEVANYAVTTRIETCDLHAKLAALYAEAQAAIKDGDLETAEEKLTDLVSLDATYGDASQQLDDIKSGKKPSASTGGDQTGGGTQPGGGGDENPTGPVMNLVRYVPDALSGFVAQGIIADPFVLTREYLPAQRGPVTHLVIVAEQFADAAGARRELDATIRTTYPDSAESFKVGGKDAYFGTRADVAVVAFIDGGVLVAAEAATSSGGGAAIESQIKAVAEEIGR